MKRDGEGMGEGGEERKREEGRGRGRPPDKGLRPQTPTIGSRSARSRHSVPLPPILQFDHWSHCQGAVKNTQIQIMLYLVGLTIRSATAEIARVVG